MSFNFQACNKIALHIFLKNYRINIGAFNVDKCVKTNLYFPLIDYPVQYAYW